MYISIHKHIDINIKNNWSIQFETKFWSQTEPTENIYILQDFN